MSKEINWSKRFEQGLNAIAIFNEKLEILDSNQAFNKMITNHSNTLDSIKNNLFITFDSGIHSWDFEGANFFVTKEKVDEVYLLTFINITNYMEILDEVIDQRIKIVNDSKIDYGNEIVSQVSHSILNPSLIIKANLNQLQKSLTNKNDLDRVSKIEHSITRIIDFSQAVSMNLINKDDTNTESLASVIKSINNYYKEDLNIYNIEFIQENILSDIEINSAIKFALVSIFENAVEELQRKSNDWIKVIYKNDNGHILEISNSGPIIPHPERVQLFIRPQTNKVDGKHSGFSLYTASNLLKSKGSKLEYECDNNIGTFKIIF